MTSTLIADKPKTYSLETGQEGAKRLDVQGEFLQEKSAEHQKTMDSEFARSYMKMAHGEWGRKTLEFGIVSAEEYKEHAKEIDQISTPFAISKGVYIIARKG